MARRQAKLLLNPGTDQEKEFPFVDRIEIGRSIESLRGWTSGIELGDPEISSRHCVLSQTADGVFLLRDLSTNGTRLDGKRLIPNVEVEIEPGRCISIGRYSLALRAEGSVEAQPLDTPAATVVSSSPINVTVLVGDIRGYTTLNQQQDPTKVSRAVHAVFSHIEELIAEYGGSIKGFPGDAVFAFWELPRDSPGDRIAGAMDAALALDRRVRELGENPDVWLFPNFPLEMDFAIATGGVAISSLGKDRPIGLSLVGDSVNLAFRIEKLATDATGPILVCSNSRSLAGDNFEFKDLGEFEVRGREGSERLFALRGRIDHASRDETAGPAGGSRQGP